MIKFLQDAEVVLSPLLEDDLELCLIWMNSLKITSLTGRPFPVTPESEKAWIQSAITSENNFVFIITLQNNTKIGTISLKDIDWKNRSAEVGIMIPNEDHQKKGIGTKALQLLVTYGFQYLNLHTIYATVFTFNKGALKMFLKVGFKEVGVKRDSYYLKGKYHDTKILDIINSNS